MNILQWVPNKGWGGGEKCVWELAAAIRERGDRVRVILPPSGILKEKFSGYDTHTFSVRGPYDLWAAVKLARIVRRYRIEVIHVHLFKHANVCLLARACFGLPVRIVMTRHLSRPAKNKLHYHWLYKHIDSLIFVSALARDRFLSSSPRISGDKLHVVLNSIRLGLSSLSGGQDRWREAGNVLVLGFAGRIVPEKGLDFLLEVLAELKKEGETVFRLLIAGTGPADYRALLEHKIRQIGLQEQVRFVGFVSDTIAFFRQTDVAVLPSQVEEACSLTILEAMVAERAIVSSDGSQSEQLKNGEEGILLAIGDRKGWTESLKVLADEPQRRMRLGAAARTRYERDFTFSQYIERVYSIYEQRKP